MTYNWMPPDDEGRLLDEVATRRNRLGALRLSISPQQGQMAEAYADAYPWMDPTAIQSFVQAGVAPDNPQVQSIAGMAAQQAASEGAFDDPADDVADPWYETLADTLLGWAKPVVRTGFTILATPFEELQALLSSAGAALTDEMEPATEGVDWVGLLNLGNIIHWARRVGPAVAGELANPGQLIEDFWVNYTEKAARSGGVLALSDLLQGKHVDLGEGWLPGGEIWEEREAAKHRLSLDGQFVTPGRLIARLVTPPGSTAYQLVSGTFDFALNVFDPVAGGLGKVAKAANRVRTFQATGLIDGLRRTVDPDAINHYLNSELGRRTVRWLTETTDQEDIWRAIGHSNLGVAARLAQSGDEATTVGILNEVLGTVIRQRPNPGFVSRAAGRITGSEYGSLFGGGAAVRRALQNVRVGLEMPTSVLNPHDINDAALQLDRWMRNARVPDHVRKARIAELASVSDGDSVGLWEVARRVMDDTEGVLVRAGMRKSDAKKLTQMYESVADEIHTFGIDALGRHEDVLGPLRVTVDGEVQATPRALPLLMSEMADEVIPLPPTVRDIRRLTPKFQQISKLYNSGLWKGSVDGLSKMMSDIWKPFQLLRGAYTVRVIGEEQLRMAGAGFDSLFSHPASAVAWMLSVDPKSRLGRRIANAAKNVIEPKGTKNVLGEAFEDIAEHKAALSRGSAGHRGLPGELFTGRYIKARHGDDPDFYVGWAVELSHMSNDPVMRRLATGLTEGDYRSIGRHIAQSVDPDDRLGSLVDDVKEWYWSGTGQKFRKNAGRMRERSALLTSREASDGYIDVFVERLQRNTGGNPDLIEAVGKGRLAGLDLRNFGSERRIARILEDAYDEAAPAFSKKPDIVRVRGASKGYDRFVEWGFDALMSKPTNWLSRSPTFRQKYWQRVTELIGLCDEATQHALIRAAKEAGLDKTDFFEEMVTIAARRGPGTRLSTLDDVDTLAKAFALDETKKLLYDLQKRSQFFDMMRLVFPFGEAWKEILGSWMRIVRQNPKVLRRFQQGLDGVRSPSVLGEPETTPGSGEGFFHTDPQTGEEVFTYPAAWVGKLLGINQGGAGVSFGGRVAGLNIVAATVLPGFGPVIQYPASKLIPQTPNYDDLREILLPFGAPQGESAPAELADIILPAWMDKILIGLTGNPESTRLFANTVADVQRALLRTGKYDIKTMDGQQRLADDAITKARILYLFRGLAQFTAPTGPSFQWSTTDVEGNVVPVKLLSDELRRLADEEYGGDRQAAFGEWVRRFGVENILAIIGKSTSLVERPVTEKGDAWLRAHADLERDYPTVIGYFAPEPAAGEFDYSAYLRQFETGARIALTPTEQIALANDFLGRIAWEQAKTVAATRPGPLTSAWLAQVRDQIAESYPGFDGWVARRTWEQRPAIDEMIAEVRQAVTQPELAQTDAGKGTILYLSALEAAQRMVFSLPGNVRRYQQAKAAAPIRFWLRRVAEDIIERHPDFARLWYGVFSRELADDELGAAA